MFFVADFAARATIDDLNQFKNSQIMPISGLAALIWAGVLHRRTRSVLTLLSTGVAFFLLGVLSGVVAAMDSLVDSLSEQRIRVVSRAGFGQDLPIAHAQSIRKLDGVAVVAPAVGFPAYFQDSANAFGGAAVDPQTYLQAMPDDVVLTAAERQAFVTTRNGAIVGAALARRFGWRVGDAVPITSTYLVNQAGQKVWPVQVVGIHNRAPTDAKIPANEIYVNLDYVDAYRADAPGSVHMFVIVSDGSVESAALSERIDEGFRNSSAATRSFLERDFFTHRMQQIGDINGIVQAILGAVFFALVFVVGSAMWHAVLRREKEFGVLKALGYSDLSVAAVVFCEVLLVVGMGALLGLGLASFVFPWLFAKIAVADMFIGIRVWALAAALTMVLAAVISLRPIWLTYRLQPAAVINRQPR